MKIIVRDFIKKTIMFEMIYMILIIFTCYFFRLPNVIRYLADILNIVVAFYVFVNYQKILNNKSLKKINILIITSIVVLLLGFFINNYSFLSFFWGCRTVFRFIIIFYGAILSFEKKDVEIVFKILHYLFIFNIFVCLFQFVFYGWNQDLLGGTFSDGSAGGNSGLLSLLFFESIYITELYLNNKVKITKYVIYVFSCFAIAALAELKIFFIIYFFIMFMSLIQNKFSYKTILTIVGGILLAVVGIVLLINLFPNFRSWFNFDKIMENFNTSYAGVGSGSLSRGTAITEITNQFFNNNLISILFGFGIGGCISSSISFFNSAFYMKYSYLHYNWFSHSFVYIETGILGLIMFYSFFIIILLFCFKKRKKNSNVDSTNKSITNIIKIFVILLLITTYYNSFLLTDSSYFAYILIAIPYILNKSEKAFVEKKVH